jgi:hypothetical protein
MGGEINHDERDSATIIACRWRDEALQGLERIDHGEARRTWGKMFVQRIGPFATTSRPRVLEEYGMIVSYLEGVPQSPPQNQALNPKPALKMLECSETDH